MKKHANQIGDYLFCGPEIESGIFRQHYTGRIKNARGGYSQKNLVGVCGPFPKTLTLFMTKICDFPYPIYDRTKNFIPYL